MPFVPMNGLVLPDEDATIWRYMDYWKFKLIFEKSALFFVRSDRFNKNDPWDSLLPQKWREKMQKIFCDCSNGEKYTEAAWYEEREIPSNPMQCWNCDEYEKERMWNEYTSDNKALVVRSTVGRFKECFLSTLDQVRIGLVNYGYHDDIDDPKFAITYWGDNEPKTKLNPWYVPLYLKRKKFDYENEIRATIHVNRDNQPIDPGYNLVIGSNGIKKLIESVHLHPKANNEHRMQVKKLLDKYGFHDILLKSSSLKS